MVLTKPLNCRVRCVGSVFTSWNLVITRPQNRASMPYGDLIDCVGSAGFQKQGEESSPGSISVGMKLRTGAPVECEVVSASAMAVFGPVMSPTPSMLV